jgi:hypothetical protein
MCSAFAIGWETSLERLAEILAQEFSLDHRQEPVS